jgi:hypothetical protein
MHPRLNEGKWTVRRISNFFFQRREMKAFSVVHPSHSHPVTYGALGIEER